MRLKYIKIAGFKSFVEPTKIELNEQITAIVGPNGCGKSNVIDAIRWVLGESSVRHLRGDAMTDVIFSGSAKRRPSGRASVELMFEQDQPLQHSPYQGYSEISIKRVVHRDGQSHYALNGKTCRRRDITEVFLGTGLSARSYAIIEQGMISRLIEAKPMDLRILLEEAAGVSQYKERRREAEQKMKTTADNLTRIQDLNTELNQQMASLSEQAQAAQQFQTYQQQLCDAEDSLHSYQWHMYTQQLRHLEAERHRLETEQHHLTAQLAEKDQQSYAHDQKQQDYRHQEQDTIDALLQAQQEIATLTQQYKQETARYEQALEQKEVLRREQAEMAKQQQCLESDLRASRDQLHEAEQGLTQYEQRKQAAQKQVQHYEARRQSLVLKSQNLIAKEYAAQKKLNQVEQQQVTLEIKRQQHTEQVQQLDQGQAQHRVSLQPQLEQGMHHLAQVQQDKKQIQSCIEQQKSLLYDLNTQKQRQHQTKHQLLTDKALLEGSLKSVEQWLAHHQPQHNLSVFQCLTYDAKWCHVIENLLETVLLQPVVHDPVHETGFVRLSQPQQWGVVTSEVNLSPWLARVCFITEPPENYQADTLYAYPDGTLEGDTFKLNFTAKEQGVLSYKKEQAQLVEQLAGVNQALKACEHIIHELAIKIKKEQRELDMKQVALLKQQASVQKAQIDLKNLQEKETSRLTQLTKIEQERQLLVQQLECIAQEQTVLQEQIESAQKCYQDIKASHQELEQEQRAWEKEGVSRDKTLQEITAQWQAIQQQTTTLTAQCYWQQKHVAESEVNRKKKLAYFEAQAQEIKRLDIVLPQQLEQLKSAEHHAQEQEAQRAYLCSVMEKMKQTTQLIVKEKQDLNKALHQLNNKLTTMQVAYAQAEGSALEQMSKLHEEKAYLKLDKADLTEHSIEQLKQNVLQSQEKIKSLGAVNLAAIEQYEAAQQRHGYLTSQSQDLEKALQGLAKAIALIDKESKQKFKKTFEQVNIRFGQLFASVFEGGHASLDMTDKDWQKTGVLIKAQPPGKKNSSIGLLSGGEKALTALSLVFSIFDLNPAPFCLLDEVDAPLDDRNIQRFCTLIKTLSNKVQFMFISHNKVTMTLAQHLMGVTMQESGVSRIVHVNMKQALDYIEAV